MTPEEIVVAYGKIKTICQKMGYRGNPIKYLKPLRCPFEHITKLSLESRGITNMSMKSSAKGNFRSVKFRDLKENNPIEILVSYPGPSFVKSSRNRDIITEHLVIRNGKWVVLSKRFLSEQTAQKDGLPILSKPQMLEVLKQLQGEYVDVEFIANEVRRLSQNIISDSNRIVSSKELISPLDHALELESYSIAWALDYQDEFKETAA